MLCDEYENQMLTVVMPTLHESSHLLEGGFSTRGEKNNVTSVKYRKSRTKLIPCGFLPQQCLST